MNSLRLAAVSGDSDWQRKLAHITASALPESRLEMVSTAREFQQQVQRVRYDCLLLDTQLPDRNGIDLLVEMHRRQLTRSPVIVITPTTPPATASRIMSNGAAAHLRRDRLDAITLRQTVQHCLGLGSSPAPRINPARHGPASPLVDAATGLAGPRVLGAYLERLLTSHTDRPYTLVLGQLKHIPDPAQTGHGDTRRIMLQAMAQRLKRSKPPNASVFRLQQADFALVCFGASSDETIKGAIRQTLKALDAPFSLRAGHNIAGGCTLGIASAPQHANTANTLMRAAWTALRQARHQGRLLGLASC